METLITKHFLTELERARLWFPSLTITDELMELMLGWFCYNPKQTMEIFKEADSLGSKGFEGYRRGIAAGKIVAGLASPKVDENGLLSFNFEAEDSDGSLKGFGMGLQETSLLGVVVEPDALNPSTEDESICAFSHDTFVILLSQQMPAAKLSQSTNFTGLVNVFTAFEEV